MEILSQKLIQDPLDLLDVSFIDFNRLNGHWKCPGDAIRTIFSWYDSMATMTVARIPNFREAPERDDWAGWNHVGSHEEIGKWYWNWFFWNHPEGELTLSDQPDFFGSFDGAMMWGDIGQVAASTFAATQKGMRAGDIWVSVLYGGKTHVIIEHHVDINELWGEIAFSSRHT